MVFPLQREKRLNPFLGMERIYPVSQSHTATGNEILNVDNIQVCKKYSYVIFAYDDRGIQVFVIGFDEVL